MTFRLLCLNKAHPNLPKLEEICPLTILSPIRKFLELHLMGKLKECNRVEINPSQTAFIDGHRCEPLPSRDGNLTKLI